MVNFQLGFLNETEFEACPGPAVWLPVSDSDSSGSSARAPHSLRLRLDFTYSQTPMIDFFAFVCSSVWIHGKSQSQLPAVKGLVRVAGA